MVTIILIILETLIILALFYCAYLIHRNSKINPVIHEAIDLIGSYASTHNLDFDAAWNKFGFDLTKTWLKISFSFKKINLNLIFTDEQLTELTT